MHNGNTFISVIFTLELWSIVEIDGVHQEKKIKDDNDIEMTDEVDGLRDHMDGLVVGVRHVQQTLRHSLRKRKKKTVFNALLDDVVNGNKIFSKCLDDLITKTTENPDSETFALSINFEGLIQTNSTKQCHHLFEIFNKSKSGEIPEKDFPIVRHPVIALFIWKKWRKAIWFFLINAVLYWFFLLNYTWMILWKFYNTSRNANVEGNTTEIGKETERTCQTDHYQDDFGHNEIILIISLILLSLWEIMQMIRLGKLYFKEVENFIEISVFATAFLLLGDIRSCCLENDWKRGIVAVGISLGWIEWVFLTGRLGLITK